MNTSYTKNYGFSAIRRSLRPLLLGKGMRLFVTVAVTVLLARYLEKTEYAVYISLQALITIVGMVSSVGIQQSMLRYIPELRSSGNNHTMYWLLSRGMLARASMVIVVLLLGLPFAFMFGDELGLETWLWVLPWYAGVGVLRLSAFSLSQSLEALLWQKQAQYGMAIGGFARLVGVIAVMKWGVLDLWAVVLIELFSELLSLVVMSTGWYFKRSADAQRAEGNHNWWQENRKRVIKFGLWSGLLNQTRTLYGSAPNRLVAAHFMGSAELALFGFADNLNNIAGRLMPTNMMMSMIRPVFIAHYSEKQDFSQLVGLSNLVYRLNLSLLALPMTLLVVVGEPFLNWLTADKYGAAAYLLAGFLALMLTEGLRTTLELLVQTVEKNQILLSNLIQSGSLLVAIPLFPYLGLWSLIVVNILGTMSANIVVVLLLRKHGYVVHFDYGLALLVAFYSLLSGALGYWCLTVTSSYLLAAVVSVLVYIACMAVKPPLLKKEKEMLTSLARGRLGKT
ncbi:lipopolysaccharide biosynthesis protein [Ketobacter sp. MCCC 1A13808]|uniref:lipopolysaccharide biosynthesis protein n=1 Tax=Ketobacter sp. MCCC 1A13808 TaxID=2602738 RepID=UPI000F228886|nr:lipopolysaccharide biosynthesis protein [Ketobacter sp. MCCC 1A13808]MVF13966.1 lipopolysaccharide biosynthesis protein [Ketobacter sp. MCCC 1A13808]RLP53432.1 MAG: lipopolysaccharide biosynthesis protein [Ketobacter sp.]